MPINQVLLSNTFNEFRTTVNEITNVVNDLTANVLSGQIVANTITVGQVSSNLIPSANITYDLGSSTNRWNDLYLSGNTIYLGDAEIKFDNGELSFTAGGSAIPVANINASNITSGTLSSARLATSGVSAGGYGSASLIPVIVVDDKGRITSAANVSVAGVSDFEYHSANANFVIYTADGGSYSTSIGQDLGTTANVTFNKVTVSGPPESTNELATKGYVDAFVEGLHIHEAVEAATNNTLTALTGGTVTYNNGTAGVGATLTLQNALTVLDGYTLQNTNRVMVKNEANTAHNGIYTWATGGTVLTRATDYDTPVEMAGGDFVFVIYGTLYADTGWVQSEPVTTVGTSAVSFIQFSGAGTYTAGTGLALNGNEFRLANTAVTAGSYGSANQIPAFTVDAQGRITTVSNVAVSGGINYVYKTANYTAQDKEGVLANTAGGAFAITLPTSPTVGMQVFIADSGDFWGTNNLTVNRNTSTIEGASENLILDVAGASVQLVYDGFTWNVYTQVGGVNSFANASLLTTGTIANARTTAASANGAATIVLRDAAGSFTANVVTATTFSGTNFIGSGASLTTLNANNISTGTLAVARGGTGVTTSTGTGNVVLSNSPTLVTPILGTPTSGTLSNCTVDGTNSVGFRTTPINSQSAAYTLVLDDSGKTILHPISDDNARTFTIPAQSSVNYPIGTVLTFVNLINTVTIAITTDTMYLAGDGTTGSRTLAAYGVATAVKVASSTWLISGNGLT